MSGAYYIVLDVPEPGFDTYVNGKFLAHHSSALNQLCHTIGLRNFDDYISQSLEDARIMIEEHGGDPDLIDIPDEKWFSVEEGLEFVTQLSSHIEAHPDSIKDAEKVLSDLQEYRQVFEQCKHIQAKWHLAVDF